MPYPQFLFSEDFILNKIAALGLTDLGKLSTALQPLNKWRLLAFRRLWQECGCQIVSISENIDDRHLRIVDEYPEAFQGRDLTIEDLVTTGIRITLHKVETPSAHRGYFR